MSAWQPTKAMFASIVNGKDGYIIAGPAYLLTQYQNAFGKRRIYEIGVWRSQAGPNMALYTEGV